MPQHPLSRTGTTQLSQFRQRPSHPNTSIKLPARLLTSSTTICGQRPRLYQIRLQTRFIRGYGPQQYPSSGCQNPSHRVTPPQAQDPRSLITGMAAQMAGANVKMTSITISMLVETMTGERDSKIPTETVLYDFGWTGRDHGDDKL
jgi:hypothetical protein